MTKRVEVIKRGEEKRKELALRLGDTIYDAEEAAKLTKFASANAMKQERARRLKETRAKGEGLEDTTPAYHKAGNKHFFRKLHVDQFNGKAGGERVYGEQPWPPPIELPVMSKGEFGVVLYVWQMAELKRRHIAVTTAGLKLTEDFLSEYMAATSADHDRLATMARTIAAEVGRTVEPTPVVTASVADAWTLVTHAEKQWRRGFDLNVEFGRLVADWRPR